MFDFGLMINSGARKPATDGQQYGMFGETVEQAVWAEEHGFQGAWVGEGRLASSAVIPMTLIAAATKRIKVGSGIVPYRTRNVGLLAVTFKTLDDLAPGRMRMGLGPWWEPLASRTGIPNRKPLKAIREVITVSRALLNGETVTFNGEFVQVDGIRFDGPNDDDGRSYPVPIYIGAVRFGMVQLAGEIADGVLLDFLVPPSYNVEAVAAAKEGAAIAGRSFDDFEVPQLIAVSVDDDDPGSAVDDCRAFLTQYIAQQSHITEFAGADPGLIAAIKSELGWPATTSQIRHTMRLVPDSLVHSVTACGTATQALDKIGEWVDTGCTEPVLTPLGDKQFGTLEAIVKAANLTGTSSRMTAQVAMAVPVVSELGATVVEAGDLEPAIELARRGRPSLFVRALRSVAVFVLILVSMLVLWELFKVLTGQSDRTMPHVWTITDYLFSQTSQDELYLSFLIHNMYVTGRGAVIGLVIGTAFGLTSGIVIARSRLAGSALLPLIVAAQTVPIVALAPALVLWLGTGSLSKAAIAAYLTFFPVAVATAKGIQNVPGSSIDVMRTYSAGRWMVLGTVQLPFALPMIFVGLETAAALSVVGAIVAELPFGARDGLGVTILTSWQFYTVQPAALYCAAIGSCVLGAVIVMVIRALRMIALRNRPPGGDVL